MKKKVYKLKKMVKYKVPRESENSHNLRMYINKRKFKETTYRRDKYRKEQNKRSIKAILWLLAFHYAWIAIILLLKHLGG